MKILLKVLSAVIIFNSTIAAQLIISNGGADYNINFDATLSGVNEGQFNGTGFSPSPSGGQLNSNAWAVSGASDGTLIYGGTQTTGDFARGVSTGNVTDGGIYAFNVLPSNNTFGIQPSTNDFTSGTVTLRILNSTAGSIIGLSLAYNIYSMNDQNRSSSLNLSYSYDNINYFDVPVFDFASIEIADPFPSWGVTNKSGVISGFNIKTGSYLYLRWVTDDISGTGSRDELALDDITVNANVTTSTIVHLANTSLTANENSGAFNINVSIQNPTATQTSVDLVLLNQLMFSNDVTGFTSQTITFPSNDGNDQSVAITINDDLISEGTEELFFVLNNVSGGNLAFIGVPDTFHLTILDNELVNLVINEVLADPSTTSGDANGDGTINTSQDEFIEFVNNELYSIDISGWTISDSVQVRHTFSPGTIISPGNVITVFGGGTPTGIPGLTQTVASFGGLGLNNGSDSIIVKNTNGTVVVRLGYGSEGGNNQSIARNPDVTGVFVQHKSIITNPVEYSPGRFNTDGSPLPVELTSFTAAVLEAKVILNWQTAMEVNNYGFEIERNTRLSPLSRGVVNVNAVWEKIGFVNGNGNSNSPKSYSFVDEKIYAGEYSYRLKQIDNDGQFEYSKTVDVSLIKPDAFLLEQNYPNPFNPATKIKYTIPSVTLRQAQGDILVSLKVFDVLGNEVATLVNEHQQPGNYEVEFNADKLSSGVYYYQLRADNFVETKKMLLLR